MASRSAARSLYAVEGHNNSWNYLYVLRDLTVDAVTRLAPDAL